MLPSWTFHGRESNVGSRGWFVNDLHTVVTIRGTLLE